MSKRAPSDDRGSAFTPNRWRASKCSGRAVNLGPRDNLLAHLNELGGAVDQNDQPNPGNPAYLGALQNLDGDMPQYISDNTDDEISHAAFLAAYLKSKGKVPVDLTPFANLQGSQATGITHSSPPQTRLLAVRCSRPT
jgi:hypothetical protein